jgi:hypothetical protein
VAGTRTAAQPERHGQPLRLRILRLRGAPHCQSHAQLAAPVQLFLHRLVARRRPRRDDRVVPGVAQNAAGQWVVDPSAYVAGGTLAKWIEFGALRPGAALGTLTTSGSITVAQEIFNLANTDINDSKLDLEKRWGLRPHKLSVFNAYDFKEGRLRGFSLGAGWRWRSANIIGTDPAGREIEGRALSYIDLMVRYSTKLPRLPGSLSFQINVNNALDNSDPVPTRLLTNDLSYRLPGGRGTAYGRLDLVDPREVRFTTTYSF